MINILINGVSRSVAAASTFTDLINELGLTGKRVAIECNGEIVPRGQFSQRLLATNDKIEIVVAVGGG